VFQSIWNSLNKIGIKASDMVATYVGTWTFILLYTTVMLVWIALHEFGVLHFDSPDYMRWNLLLSWFAGIQAPAILMVSNRQSRKDRELMDDTHDTGEAILSIAKNNQKRVYFLIKQISQLEEVIDDLIEEKIEGHEK